MARRRLRPKAKAWAILRAPAPSLRQVVSRRSKRSRQAMSSRRSGRYLPCAIIIRNQTLMPASAKSETDSWVTSAFNVPAAADGFSENPAPAPLTDNADSWTQWALRLPRRSSTSTTAGIARTAPNLISAGAIPP